MYALLILMVAGLAFAMLLMAGVRLSQALLASGFGAVAALGVMVAMAEYGPDARWADIRAEAYDVAYRERNADVTCASFEDRNIFSRYFGRDRWCAEWIERKAGAARYAASVPCREDLGARREELASISGATEVVDGKRYIVKAYADEVCGSQ